MIFNQLQQRITTSKSIDFGDTLSRSIELFKKVWVQGFIILLLSGLLTIPFIIVIYIPAIILGVSAESLDNNFLETMGIAIGLIMVVLLLVMLLGIITIATGLRLAFYRILKMKDLQEMGSEDYFYFLKKQ